MAIFMLTCFCLILIGEIAAGNADCGCLGSKSPPIWVMLGIDAALLLAVLFFKPARPDQPVPAMTPRAGVATAALTLVGAVASFGVVVPAGEAPPVATSDNGTPDGGAAKTLPGVWYVSDIDSWIGRPWQEIDLLGYLPEPPKGIDGPRRHIVFYGRTCDHCEEMFYFDLTDPGLAETVTAVEVPAAKDHLRDAGAWDMPETGCELMTLPLGCDWIISTPLTITVENGIVTCATEGDHAECMGL